MVPATKNTIWHWRIWNRRHKLASRTLYKSEESLARAMHRLNEKFKTPRGDWNFYCTRHKAA